MTSCTRSLVVAVVGTLAVGSTARGQAFSEGFDSVATLMAPGSGWVFINNTPNPNPNGAWRQGDLTDGGKSTAAFPPHSGGDGSYIRSDYTATLNSASGPAVTVSDWMVLPTRTLNNGDQLSYYTRSNGNGAFAERLLVRLSTAGASANVGTLPTEVGDFTRVLEDINSGYALFPDPNAYPLDWELHTVTVSGLSGPTLARIAFQHFVEDSGPAGNNGNQLGIDTLSFTPVPEPTSLLLVSGLAAATARRLSRRRRSAAAPASPESRPG